MKSSPASHTPLDSEKNEIRLLQIAPRKAEQAENDIGCDVFLANLDQHPSYKALSYTWGDALGSHYDIFLNGQRFRVRQNLWEALNRFQSVLGGMSLWIDILLVLIRAAIQRRVSKLER